MVSLAAPSPASVIVGLFDMAKSRSDSPQLPHGYVDGVLKYDCGGIETDARESSLWRLLR
jgi:hypothetical protein